MCLHSAQNITTPNNGRAIIGRHPNCDIVLEGLFISQRQAEVNYDGWRLTIRNLSHNHCFAVDDRVVYRGQTRELPIDSTITFPNIGDYTIIRVRHRNKSNVKMDVVDLDSNDSDATTEMPTDSEMVN